MTRPDAVQQQLSVPTMQKGTFAQGHKLFWRKHTPSYLPAVFQVPWTYVDEQNILSTPQTLTPENVWVWERVPKTAKKQDDMAYIIVHMYFNYYLKHHHAALNGVNPILPLLDVQTWTSDPAITMVTPMFYQCNKHWQSDSDSQKWFWTFSTLMSLLVLHATGLVHTDLSQNNLFQIQNQPCILKYKERTLALPFFPVMTDFDDVCFAWETQAEREQAGAEKDVIRFLLTEQLDNCEHYSKLSPTADMHVRELKKQRFSTVDSCLHYLFSMMQPQGVCCGPQGFNVDNARTVDFTERMFFNDNFYTRAECVEGIRFVMQTCHCDTWNKNVYDACYDLVSIDECDMPKNEAKSAQLNLFDLGFKSKKPRYAKMMLLLV